MDFKKNIPYKSDLITNMVLDEMDRQLDKIKLFKDQPDSTEHAQTQKPTINGEPVIAKMPTYSAKTNVQRLTGQPLAYAPKPVQVQRNNAENHQPPLSRISHSTRTEPPNSYIRKNKSANGTSYSTRHP
jgi:hypothetical protein